MAWKCALCAFTALFLSILIAHYKSRHASSETCVIKCNVNGCTKEYWNLKSFASHVYGKHSMFLQCSGPSETGGEPTLTTLDAQSDQHHVHESVSVPDNSEHEDDDSDSCDNLSQCTDGVVNDVPLANNTEEAKGTQLPKFLFKIKEENKLTQKCLQQIASATKQLLEGSLKRIKRKAETSLSNAGIDSSDVAGFDNAFLDDILDCNNIQAMASNVENLHKTENCNIPFVEPQKVLLGKRHLPRKRNYKKRRVLVEDFLYYIPILGTLQIQLSSQKILNMVLNGPELSKNADVLSDFCDGTFVQNHELFSNDDTALQILLYYDDVNLCNPLTNKIHKITLFYYQLANIHVEYRSKLNSIHLLGVCKTDYVKMYGINRIFEPLVKELKVLGSERGHSFNVFGGQMNLRGAVLAFLADTPASNLGAGFKESVGGARKKCRHCDATFETMQDGYSEEEFTLRCKEEHEEQLQRLEKAPNKFLRKYYSKLFGVNCRSHLGESPYFDMCEQFPQDIMHVFLEGVFSYELKYLLKYYMDVKKLFTLQDLNKEIQTFPFGYSHTKDKPCVIKAADLERESSSNLGQGAAKMWLLAQIMPLILSKFVDTSTEHWECLSSLLEIMGIVFSTRISVEAVVYLKSAINNHLRLFKNVFPDAPIIPKQHFLVHIPSQILKFGPLIRSWCMRFEGKHAYFKDLAKKVKNFKNIPHSLAHKHQKVVCAEHLTLNSEDVETSPLFGHEISLGINKVLYGDDLKAAKESITRFFPADRDELNDIRSCNSITLNGTRYCPGVNNLVQIGYTVDGLPEFGSLVKIWHVSDSSVVFATKVMESVGFIEELNAVEVSEPSLPEGLQVSRPADLPNHQVHHAYGAEGKKYIPLRQYIFGTD